MTLDDIYSPSYFATEAMSNRSWCLELLAPHCLETDVVAEGRTPTKAFETLSSLTAMQVDVAVEESNLESIFKQAPREICAAFAVGQTREIRRKPPKYVQRFDVRDLQPA
jgi:hypothetical protein